MPSCNLCDKAAIVSVIDNGIRRDLCADHNPRCVNCRFYNATEESGECRKYPPRLVNINGDQVSAFPDVSADCWCGAFERR